MAVGIGTPVGVKLCAGENRSEKMSHALNVSSVALLKLLEFKYYTLPNLAMSATEWALYRIHLSALIDPSVELTVINMWCLI